jgi:hypothetical protein
MFISDDGVDVTSSVFNERPFSGSENSLAALRQSTLTVVCRIGSLEEAVAVVAYGLSIVRPHQGALPSLVSRVCKVARLKAGIDIPQLVT